jgi:hypothetical protein
MAKARKPRAKRPKQGYLHPDMAPPSIPEIDAIAERYYEQMMERVALSKLEDEAKTELIEVMAKHGQTRYVTLDGFIVHLLSKSNIRIKKKKDVEANGDESNGEA